MKCCQGSGAVEGDRFRNTLKHPSRLKGWGLPAGAEPRAIRVTGSHGSVSLQYDNGAVAAASSPQKLEGFQAGAWLARTEVTRDHLHSLMRKNGLAEYTTCADAYLDDIDLLLQTWGPLLLTRGRDSVRPEDLPVQLPVLANKLSFNIVDDDSSKFGNHRDTPQLQGNMLESGMVLRRSGMTHQLLLSDKNEDVNVLQATVRLHLRVRVPQGLPGHHWW